MRCDDSKLVALLEADNAESMNCAETSLHLESCPPCRERLEELAGGRGLWDEIGASLTEEVIDLESWERQSGGDVSIVVALEPSLNDDLVGACDVVSLSFLEPPRHPEMLGRLGRYDVERVIGSGGMGVVLKAFDTELHRFVAVKALAPHLAGNGAARVRFAREAQAAASVAHHNVTPIHDVQPDNMPPYLVMPYISGRSLQARVDERGPLAADEALRIMQQAAAGLAAAHAQGLVHRDVKPANILVEEGGRAMLSDFGLARAVDDSGLTRTGVVAGTPHYMSPEQARGQQVDSRSDLYSLGSVLYFMLTGRPPFARGGPMAVLNSICHEQHRPLAELRPEAPTAVIELADRLLSKEPEQRPASADEVRQHCELLLRRPSALPRKTAPLPWKAVVTGSAISVALLGLLIALQGGPAPDPSAGGARREQATIAEQIIQQPTETETPLAPMEQAGVATLAEPPDTSDPPWWFDDATFADQFSEADAMAGNLQQQWLLRSQESITSDSAWTNDADQLRTLTEQLQLQFEHDEIPDRALQPAPQ